MLDTDHIVGNTVDSSCYIVDTVVDSPALGDIHAAPGDPLEVVLLNCCFLDKIADFHNYNIPHTPGDPAETNMPKSAMLKNTLARLSGPVHEDEEFNTQRNCMITCRG